MTTAPRTRRSLLRHAAGAASALGAVSLAAMLGGCGFALRRPPELKLQRLHLAGFDARSTMAAALRRQLRQSPGVELVEAEGLAQATIVALVDANEQAVAGSTATGQVRELTLRSRFKFLVRAADGRELVRESELVLERTMSYSETAALAKEQEANMLYRAMENDIAAQVLRRLAALPA